MESNQGNIKESERQVTEQITHFLSEEDSIDNQPQQQSRSQERRILAKTIAADVISNRKFLGRQTKITIAIIIFILFLQILPSPLIQTKVENDPLNFSKEPCSESAEQCGSVSEGYQTVIINHVNPLQRDLKYFVRLNKAKLDELSKYYPQSSIDINKEITWVQIYASRNGQIYGDVISERDGQDIYQLIFDQQPLIFIGEVLILEEQSYLVKIYKVLKTVNATDRLLQKAIKPQPISEVGDDGNGSKPINNNSTNKTMEISVPLTVQMIRYSEFYTVTELVIRYIAFLFALYVRIDTKQSPIIFHIILILVSNPLIFIELASPNFATHCLSTIFSSTYFIYFAVFLFYWHRRFKNGKANVIIVLVKILAFMGLWISSVFRYLHIGSQAKVEIVQTIFMILVLLPLMHHLWKLYFFKIKTVLHRNVLFIALTVYYLLFLFLSQYIVRYGWKKISFFLIVQTYGIQLCYLTASTTPTSQNKEEIIEEQQAVPSSDVQQRPKQPQFITNSPEYKQKGTSSPFIAVD